MQKPASIDQSSGRGVRMLEHEQHASAAPSVAVIVVRNRQSVELHAECMVLAG